MAPYSFFNGLWTGGRNSKTPPTTRNQPNTFDGAASDQGETKFTTESFRQDYENGKTQQTTIQPEYMDMGQTLDPAEQCTDEVGARANFMQYQHRYQDSSDGETGRSRNEEEYVETSQTLNADDQLVSEAGADKSSLQHRYQDQNHHYSTEYSQHVGKEADHMDVDQIFTLATEFKDREAPGHIAVMEIDHHDKDEELQQSVDQMEPFDTSKSFNPTYQQMNGVESSNFASAGQNLHYNGGQMQQPDRHMEHADANQMFSFPDQFTNLAVPKEAVYSRKERETERGTLLDDELQHGMMNAHNIARLQKFQSVPCATFRPDVSSNEYNFEMLAYGAQPGKSHADFFDPHVLAQETHNTNPGYGIATGHADIAKSVVHSAPSKLNDKPVSIDLCDSSDDEPLQTQAQRHTDSNLHQSISSDESQTGVQDVIHSAAASEDESEVIKFDFKLPTHEAMYEKDASGYATAKVSLPGLVREPILLSPDHSEHEYQLFLDVFLPSQIGLATPDPQPAIAVLNFHTIANIVIDTYDQLVVQENQELDALDTDEVFFQVMDKWRVGMLSNKKSYKLIRGVQEFVDLALDLVFWVKEHGLWTPPPPEKKERKERSDKGTKRVSKAGSADTVDMRMGTKKSKVPPARKVTELQARKKESVKAKEKGKPAPKLKAKLSRTPGYHNKDEKKDLGKITVIKKGRVNKKK
jgi:hypothetical protein